MAVSSLYLRLFMRRIKNERRGTPRANFLFKFGHFITKYLLRGGGVLVSMRAAETAYLQTLDLLLGVRSLYSPLYRDPEISPLSPSPPHTIPLAHCPCMGPTCTPYKIDLTYDVQAESFQSTAVRRTRHRKAPFATARHRKATYEQPTAP